MSSSASGAKDSKDEKDAAPVASPPPAVSPAAKSTITPPGEKADDKKNALAKSPDTLAAAYEEARNATAGLTISTIGHYANRLAINNGADSKAIASNMQRKHLSYYRETPTNAKKSPLATAFDAMQQKLLDGLPSVVDKDEVRAALRGLDEALETMHLNLLANKAFNQDEWNKSFEAANKRVTELLERAKKQDDKKADDQVITAIQTSQSEFRAALQKLQDEAVLEHFKQIKKEHDSRRTVATDELLKLENGVKPDWTLSTTLDGKAASPDEFQMIGGRPAIQDGYYTNVAYGGTMIKVEKGQASFTDGGDYRVLWRFRRDKLNQHGVELSGLEHPSAVDLEELKRKMQSAKELGLEVEIVGNYRRAIETRDPSMLKMLEDVNNSYQARKKAAKELAEKSFPEGVDKARMTRNAIQSATHHINELKSDAPQRLTSVEAGEKKAEMVKRINEIKTTDGKETKTPDNKEKAALIQAELNQMEKRLNKLKAADKFLDERIKSLAKEVAENPKAFNDQRERIETLVREIQAERSDLMVRGEVLNEELLKSSDPAVATEINQMKQQNNDITEGLRSLGSERDKEFRSLAENAAKATAAQEEKIKKEAEAKASASSPKPN